MRTAAAIDTTGSRKGVKQANMMNVAEALRLLLTQTQDHVMDLRTALGK